MPSSASFMLSNVNPMLSSANPMPSSASFMLSSENPMPSRATVQSGRAEQRLRYKKPPPADPGARKWRELAKIAAYDGVQAVELAPLPVSPGFEG
ncbi:hypothetical protein U1Q18_018382 [Sarracenia purpurea var. burkii]